MDPAKLLQAKEEKTCVGCIFEIKSIHSARVFCAKLKNHGKRCGLYEERAR